MADESHSSPLEKSSSASGVLRCDVLVIDDDDEVRTFIIKALRQWGYQVEGAENGRAALSLISQRTFRLVITDIYMPKMDGYEMVTNLAKVVPRPAVLVMSGGARGAASGDLKIAKLLGCEHTLVKPFTLAGLKSAVQILIGAPSSK